MDCNIDFLDLTNKEGLDLKRTLAIRMMDEQYSIGQVEEFVRFCVLITDVDFFRISRSNIKVGRGSSKTDYYRLLYHLMNMRAFNQEYLHLYDFIRAATSLAKTNQIYKAAKRYKIDEMVTDCFTNLVFLDSLSRNVSLKTKNNLGIGSFVDTYKKNNIHPILYRAEEEERFIKDNQDKIDKLLLLKMGSLIGI